MGLKTRPLVRRGRVTNDERQIMREMWLQGQWYPAIADATGRPEETVEDVLHNQLEFERPSCTPSACKLARDIYESGETLEEVGAQVDRHKSTARTMILMAGGSMRRRGWKPEYVAPRKVRR